MGFADTFFNSIGQQRDRQLREALAVADLLHRQQQTDFQQGEAAYRKRQDTDEKERQARLDKERKEHEDRIYARLKALDDAKKITDDLDRDEERRKTAIDLADKYMSRGGSAKDATAWSRYQMAGAPPPAPEAQQLQALQDLAGAVLPGMAQGGPGFDVPGGAGGFAPIIALMSNLAGMAGGVGQTVQQQAQMDHTPPPPGMSLEGWRGVPPKVAAEVANKQSLMGAREFDRDPNAVGSPASARAFNMDPNAEDSLAQSRVLAAIRGDTALKQSYERTQAWLARAAARSEATERWRATLDDHFQDMYDLRKMMHTDSERRVRASMTSQSINRLRLLRNDAAKIGLDVNTVDQGIKKFDAQIGKLNADIQATTDTSQQIQKQASLDGLMAQRGELAKRRTLLRGQQAVAEQLRDQMADDLAENRVYFAPGYTPSPASKPTAQATQRRPAPTVDDREARLRAKYLKH